MAQYPYPANLAVGVTNEGSFLPAELFAGESDIVTDRGVCGTATIQILQIVARNAAGQIVPYDAAAVTASLAPIGIAAQGATVGEGIPYFTGGVFNHELLIWPATVDTLTKRQALFDRTNIQMSHLIGVATNIVYP